MKLKRFEDFLLEKRSHAETNVDVLFQEFLFDILRNNDIKNIFVSFRDSEHVTDINPNNKYNTPTGFYAYPLASYQEKIQNVNEKQFRRIFPFQNELPYMYFLILDNFDGILTSETTDNVINYYMIKLTQLYGHITPVANLCKLFSEGKYTPSYSKVGVIHNVHLFWLFIYEIAPYIMNNKFININGIEKYNTKTQHNTTFTIICNKIGIKGFIDYNGDCFIHAAEPFQGVFFKVKNIGKLLIYKKPKFNMHYIKDKLKKHFPLHTIFDWVSKSTNRFGLREVKMNDKTTFIYSDNELIYNGNMWFDYVYIEDDNGMFKVVKDDKLNYLSGEGDLLNELWFDSVENFRDGYSLVYYKGRCTLMNLKGELLKDNGKLLTFNDITFYDGFDKGFAKVYDVHRGFSYIDIDGNLIGKGKLWFTDALNFDSKGYATVYINKDEYELDSNCVLYDLRGNIIKYSPSLFKKKK